VNRLDGFVDIAHLARPVRGDPLNVCVLTQTDECSAALGRYPDHADTRPRSFVAHTASLAGTCHAIVEGSLNRPGLPGLQPLEPRMEPWSPSTRRGSGTRPPPRGTRPTTAAGAVGADYSVYGRRKLWNAARRAGIEAGGDQVARLMRSSSLAIQAASSCPVGSCAVICSHSRTNA